MCRKLFVALLSGLIVKNSLLIRGGGTGPADLASARPIILAQLVNIHTNAHAKPYLPLVYSTLDGQFSSLEFKY